MIVNKGDLLVTGNKEYEVVDYNAVSDTYWMREKDDPFIFIWSSWFIQDQILKNKMTVIKKDDHNCWHVFESKPLFRFVYRTCIKCGKSDGVVNMMEKK